MFDAQSISALSPTQRDHQSPVTLCNKQSFQSISVILLYPFHTLASLSITLTSNNSRHSLLHYVSHRLSFSFLLSLSWMGVNRQILFNPMPTLLHTPLIPFIVSHSRLSVLSRHPSQAYCTALHGTARHCTAQHSATRLHHPCCLSFHRTTQ